MLHNWELVEHLSEGLECGIDIGVEVRIRIRQDESLDVRWYTDPTSPK